MPHVNVAIVHATPNSYPLYINSDCVQDLYSFCTSFNWVQYVCAEAVCGIYLCSAGRGWPYGLQSADSSKRRCLLYQCLSPCRSTPAPHKDSHKILPVVKNLMKLKTVPHIYCTRVQSCKRLLSRLLKVLITLLTP